jgi:hypothetical protein
MSEKWTKDDQEWAKEVLACRQIVDEINRFGVNQKQRLKIIELLSLEIEDRETSVGIAKTAKGLIEKIETSPAQTQTGRILV